MKTLFVSTDFSAAGNNAVKFAAHLASGLGSTLVVFHAAHLPPFKPTIDDVELAQLKRDTEEEQKHALDALVNDLYRAQGLVRREDSVMVASRIGTFAADVILEAAKEHHADLIVVGTHGASGLKLLGSNTCEIIFKAESPVLSIPPQSEFKKIETVLYATDLRNTMNELRHIIPIASRLQAVIEILNLDFDGDKSHHPMTADQLIKDLKYNKIKVVVQKEMKGMTILRQLESYVASRQPDILVMFPEERSVLDKIFVRSKTEELLYHAKLPLMTFLKSRVESDGKGQSFALQGGVTF